MRNRRHVGNRRDLEPGRLQRADGGLAAGTRALDEDLDLLQTVLHRATRGRLCRDLRGERGALPRALEALAAGTAPGEHVPLRVRQRDHGVIERGLDVRLADRDVLLLAAAGAADFLLRHALLLCLGLLAHAVRLAPATAGARVAPGALAAAVQPATGADGSVGAGLHRR